MTGLVWIGEEVEGRLEPGSLINREEHSGEGRILEKRAGGGDLSLNSSTLRLLNLAYLQRRKTSISY